MPGVAAVVLLGTSCVGLWEKGLLLGGHQPLTAFCSCHLSVLGAVAAGRCSRRGEGTPGVLAHRSPQPLRFCSHHGLRLALLLGMCKAMAE